MMNKSVHSFLTHLVHCYFCALLITVLFVLTFGAWWVYDLAIEFGRHVIP
jgi:hypothetical protein